jgi:hypothetical protein
VDDLIMATVPAVKEISDVDLVAKVARELTPFGLLSPRLADRETVSTRLQALIDRGYLIREGELIRRRRQVSADPPPAVRPGHPSGQRRLNINLSPATSDTLEETATRFGVTLTDVIRTWAERQRRLTRLVADGWELVLVDPTGKRRDRTLDLDLVPDLEQMRIKLPGEQ